MSPEMNASVFCLADERFEVFRAREPLSGWSLMQHLFGRMFNVGISATGSSMWWTGRRPNQRRGPRCAWRKHSGSGINNGTGGTNEVHAEALFVSRSFRSSHSDLSQPNGPPFPFTTFCPFIGSQHQEISLGHGKRTVPHGRFYSLCKSHFYVSTKLSKKLTKCRRSKKAGSGPHIPPRGSRSSGI